MQAILGCTAEARASGLRFFYTHAGSCNIRWPPDLGCGIDKLPLRDRMVVLEPRRLDASTSWRGANFKLVQSDPVVHRVQPPLLS